MFRLCKLTELKEISNRKLLENTSFGYTFAEECDTSKNYLV